MPDLQFKREYELIVDDLLITDLDIAFNATRHLEPEPNTLDLTIFNLSAATRDAIQKKRLFPVQLRAGYESRIGTVFLGVVREAFSELQASDWITTIAAGDGEDDYQAGRINQSFAPGTELTAVMEALAKAMPNIDRGNLRALSRRGELPQGGDQFVNGVTVSGQAQKEMTRICKSAGLEWSIQDGKLQVLKAKTVLQDTAVVLNAASGLVGSPTIGNDGVVNFVCLINPNIIPGKQLVIESQHVSGRFRFERGEYTGDTAGIDWYIRGEAQELTV